jgi:hypothetical protein
MLKTGGVYVNKKLCNVHMCIYPSSTNLCLGGYNKQEETPAIIRVVLRVDNPGSQKIKKPLGVHNHNSFKF